MSLTVVQPKRYMITDRRLAGGLEPLLQLIARRLDEGIDFVQIREKDLDARSLYRFTRRVLELPHGHTRILVNSRLDIALAASAHGVHLPAGSPAPSHLRSVSPSGFLLGVSCHTPADVASAHAAQADYCLFSPVFRPQSKSDYRVTTGLSGLASAVRAAPIPVFALGGVTFAHSDSVASTGAAGIAGITLFV